ncbi:hypothetical protein VWH97_07105 [Escherichia coli O157]|nr:hypothetical protein [Escherichia coli O157]
MTIAIQTPKTKTAIGLLVSLVIIAAFGFYGFSQHDRASSSGESQVHNLKPQVTQIQKQELPKGYTPKVVPGSEKHYTVEYGDSYHSIAKKFKPHNVLFEDYVTVLKNINLNAKLHTSQGIFIPTKEDLKDVLLPDVVVLFDYNDPEIVAHIKEAEGSIEFQSKNKRRLLGGKVGVPFYNSKFHPYKDMKGNYTIAYGHYLGPRESDAIKYRNGITVTEAHNLLLTDMKRINDELILLLKKKNATYLTVEQQIILFDMAFTLGINKLNTFNKLWKSVEKRNAKKFKKEIKNSLWYRQVGKRGELLVNNL